MKKHIKPIFSLFTLSILCLLFSPAYGQMDDNYRNYRDWDKNNNEKLSFDEFFEGVTKLNTFDTWDEDDNGILDKGELQSGIYKKWEAEGENFQTGDEARVRTWGRYYAGTFDDWDLNGDGTVTNAEFSERVGNENRNNLEKKMDLNNDDKVLKKEFYTAIFKMWDDDENGFLSQEEYDQDEFESWFL